MFTPQKPHFCKIILEDDRLRFPRRFIRKHGSELSSPLQLKVPDGLTFQIEMARYDGEVWFENGWRQFYEHYSLKQGYFLLFEYEGNCSFQVLIFDLSATEINYPYVSNSDDRSGEECQRPNKDEEEANDDSSTGILKMRKKYCPSMNKRKTTLDEEEPNGCDEEITSVELEEILNSTTPVWESNKDEKETNDGSSSGVLKMRKKYCPSMDKRETNLDEEEPNGCDKEINSVELEEILNQIIPVWETNKDEEETNDDSSAGILKMRKKYCPSMKKWTTKVDEEEPNRSDEEITSVELEEILNQTSPVWETRKEYCRLCKKYRKTTPDMEEEGKEEEYVEILTSESEWKTSDKEEEEAKDNTSAETQKETPLSKKYRCPNKKRKTTSYKNTNDSEDASSREGDLQMVVRGNLESGTKDSTAPLQSVPPTPLQRASAFESDNPFFIVEVQPSYIYPGLKMVIPSNFTATYLLKKADDVTLCTLDGKTWYARYFRYETNNKYTRAVLCDGWRKFVRDNGLQLGDVCVFELIKRTKILMKVVIYRVRKDSNSCSSLGGMNSVANCGSGSLSKQRSTKSKHLCSVRPWLSAHEKARALLRAKDFKSENPYFKLVIQPAYIGARWRVYIPCKFAKTYLDEKKGRVILQVSEGSTWVIKFSIMTAGTGQRKAQFCSTWKQFALDNNLEVGDVCVFELIDRKKALFNVSIF